MYSKTRNKKVKNMTKKEKETRRDFDSWYDAIEDIADKGILLVKNGLEYLISLTTNKKPLYKKQSSKLFTNLRKKYEVTGVNLEDIQIADQIEIDAIITQDPTQEKNFLRIQKMQLNTTYVLKLTEQQYKSLTNFMQFNEMTLGDKFYFRRFGSGFNTYFTFSKISLIKVKRQKNLGEKSGKKKKS